MSQSFGFVSILCLLAGTALAQSPGVIHSEFIYEQASFPRCHASTIVETPDGLAVAWFGGTEEKSPDVGIWLSHERHGQWSNPVEVANGVQFTRGDGSTFRHPCWNPVLYQQPSGPLLLFYKCGPSPSTWWGMLMKSADNGQTWSIPRRLPDQIDGPVRNKPVLLSDGALLCGSSTEYDGWRVHFEITRDAGRTWSRIGPIHDGKKIGAIQPTILKHADGRLQVLCRNKNGNGEIVQTRSTDQGMTWSELKPIGLPNPNSGIDGVTLQDGRHLLVYNHTTRSSTPRGRAMLNVSVSDDGEAWDAALVLENEPRAEFSYPAVIQSADGRVHIVYTWKRQRIRHVVVDPSELKPVPIVEGKWPPMVQGGPK